MQQDYKEEKYYCQKCGKLYYFTIVSNIFCKDCGWRIFRKEMTDKVIRIKAI